MNSEEYGFRQVNDTTYICVADADTRAVMGAKTSRAPHLKKRWDELMASNDGQQWPWGQPPEMVTKFLDTNLKKYMHSSIAEMAEVFVHGRGMGWPAAWLIEDSPLFVGQEVSTRAVDVLKDDSRICDYAPSHPHLQEIHDGWLELFERSKSRLSQKGGYKFDDMRGVLPGTTRSGVTMCNKVRDGVRQLEMLQGLGYPYDEMADRFLEGFEAYAPRATDAVRRGPRNPPASWQVGLVSANAIPGFVEKDVRVSVTSRRSVRSRLTDVLAWRIGQHREKANTYLDPSWAFYGPFEVSIVCSVAAARDWHRHRAVMPWQLEVIRDPKSDKLYYQDSIVQDWDDALWEKTQRMFHDIYTVNLDLTWQSLYALPFATLVRLKCQATLPALLYMLELRYSAGGANAEYKAQAKEGLYSLAATLGERVTEKESILGALNDEDRQRWEKIKHYF